MDGCRDRNSWCARFDIRVRIVPVDFLCFGKHVRFLRDGKKTPSARLDGQSWYRDARCHAGCRIVPGCGNDEWEYIVFSDAASLGCPFRDRGRNGATAVVVRIWCSEYSFHARRFFTIHRPEPKLGDWCHYVR